MEPINNIYIESIRKQFLYYKTLGEKAMEQLEPEKLFTVFSDDSNSISVVVKHISGNLLSRWTDFLTTDGEKPWRNRDDEFIDNIKDKNELMHIWQKGWECLIKTIDSIKPDQLTNIIYIRNEGLTVIDAMNRSFAHTVYHVGQIVYAAKILKNEDWISLTIPKNKSNEFNKDKFEQEKT